MCEVAQRLPAGKVRGTCVTMLSRRTALAIADAYSERFSMVALSSGTADFVALRDDLYEFLYEREFEAWFCNLARQLGTKRDLRDWILRLHTGETVSPSTPNWDWKNREKLGQQHLLSLARHIVLLLEEESRSKKRGFDPTSNSVAGKVLTSLELDGYVRRDDQFFPSEADVINVDQEIGLLQKLHTNLQLPDQATLFSFLVLSEQHYASERWSDSIGNSRKFFEALVLQVANAMATTLGVAQAFDDNRPVEVRRYLETNGLLDRHEREAIDKLYALLSHTGAHPYLAQRDQARLLRQLAATLSQFVLLRLEGRRLSTASLQPAP
jgi:hypothetical protein